MAEKYYFEMGKGTLYHYDFYNEYYLVLESDNNIFKVLNLDRNRIETYIKEKINLNQVDKLRVVCE